MSTEKTSQLVKRIHDELTCAVCLDRFRSPKILPCLHSFCSECLQNLISRSPNRGHIACPECRVQHAVPKKGFTNHFILGKLVEHLTVLEAAEEKEGASKIKCESGLDTNPAAGRCVDCQVYLCQHCMDLHKKQKFTMQHQTLTLAEIKEGALTSVHEKHMCSEHEGEELKLYCRTCREVICRDCTFDAHQKHVFVLVKKVKEELAQELRGLMAQAEEKEKDFHHCVERVDQVVAAKENNFAACEQQIKECFGEYMQKIQQRQASLLDKLNRAQATDIKHLDAEKYALELNKAKIASGVSVTKQLLLSGSAIDIALLSKQASDQLRSLASIESGVEIEMHEYAFDRKADLLESSVAVLHVDVDVPSSIPLGLNKLQVTSPIKPNVNITTSSNTPCKVTEIISTGPSSWSVTYVVPAPPVPNEVQISVRIDGTSVRRSLQIKCIDKLAEGTRVVRGPGWEWKNQDGGPGKQGTISMCSVATGKADTLNANVTWDSGKCNCYYWGNHGGRYDLQVAPN